MKKFLSLMLIASLSMMLVACNKAKEDIYEVEKEIEEASDEVLEPVKISDVKITMQDDKTAIIELEGNPTTGYEWIPLNYDDHTLNIEKEFVSSQADEKIAGAGGVFKFTITGLREGKTLVDFTYMREWEGQGSALENHPVEVNVGEDMILYIPVV